MRNSPKPIISVSSPILFFNVWNDAAFFQYAKKYWRNHILTLHALQEASNILVILILRLLDIYVYISLIVFDTSFEPYCKVSETFISRYPAQMNIITKELDIRKHFCVSFYVVAIKINSFITLACYTICPTVKIC